MAVWIGNLRETLKQRPVVLLHGNIRDLYFDTDESGLGHVYESLGELLEGIARTPPGRAGEVLIRYDAAEQERRSELGTPGAAPAPAPAPAAAPAAGSAFGPPPAARGGAQRQPPDRTFAGWVEELAADRPRRFVIVDYLDKLVGYNQSYHDPESTTLIWLQKVIDRIANPHRLVLVALRETMVPVELYSSSPKTAVLAVPLPEKLTRLAFLRHQIGSAWEPAALELVANLTEGLYLRDLRNLVPGLQQIQTPDQRRVSALINQYRFGAREDQWGQLSLDKLNSGRKYFIDSEGVKGQDAAVDQVITTLRVARAGLSGLASGNAARPKGTLFFAGPSGVGKTLLAKKLAKFLFGHEDYFLRFDMSELKEEHTVSKLIGSPPGYVGSDRGGMLTNAIREKPFSVVLFDEVEKAHPRILDLFLQILDDGRLTDSTGQTVYFTEAVLVFTSNLGTRSVNSRGTPCNEKEMLDALLRDATRAATPEDKNRATPEEKREKVRKHFIHSVERYFQTEISRPELLNRIGGNIVPFDFIQTEEAQKGIIEFHLKRMAQEFAQIHQASGFRLEHDAAVTGRLVRMFGPDIERGGGRGIVNALERAVVGQLAGRVLAAESQQQHRVLFRIVTGPNDADGIQIEEASGG